MSRHYTWRPHLVLREQLVLVAGVGVVQVGVALALLDATSRLGLLLRAQPEPEITSNLTSSHVTHDVLTLASPSLFSSRRRAHKARFTSRLTWVTSASDVMSRLTW